MEWIYVHDALVYTFLNKSIRNLTIRNVFYKWFKNLS